MLPVVQDFSKDERAALALKARAHAPVFGSPDRQAVTNEVHAKMLLREPQVAARPPGFAACRFLDSLYTPSGVLLMKQEVTVDSSGSYNSQTPSECCLHSRRQW